MTREEAEKKMGISYLKPYQELIVDHILADEENHMKTRLLGCLPTGSGKTLCFMLPMLTIGKTTICIYPLLSLMADQARRFGSAGIPYAQLKGGMKKEERERILASLETGETLALITSMEMLLYLMEKGELERIRGKVSMAVVDEAHTTVTWGDTFRESYRKLGAVLEYLAPDHILAFTATMDKKIARGIMDRVFGGIRPYVVHGSSDRENIFYSSIRSFSKPRDLKRLLQPPESRPAVIFCRSREETRRIAETLLAMGFEADYYNASLEKEERTRKEEWFFSSHCGVLAATTAYGMGVSKDDIRTIIHYSLPEDPTAFLQESGRGGRDGKLAVSHVLYSPTEESPLSGVFKGTGCIRTQLLTLMDEETEEERCLGCSHCVGQSYIPYGEKEVLGYLKHRPFSTVETLCTRLTSPSLFHRKDQRKMEKKEVLDILDGLAKEGKIRMALGLVKKGKEINRGDGVV